jgi:hypothetical protein
MWIASSQSVGVGSQATVAQNGLRGVVHSPLAIEVFLKELGTRTTTGYLTAKGDSML